MTAMGAALLAGGASRRMGQDKAMLRLHGATLLERTAAVAAELGLPIVVVGRAEPADWHGPMCQFVADDHPGTGPLAGICTALKTASMPRVVLPCDMPGLEAGAIHWLLDVWQVIGGKCGLIATRAERLEPLFGIYTQLALIHLEAQRAVGVSSCSRAIQAGEFSTVVVPQCWYNSLDDCDTFGQWQAVRCTRGSSGV